MKFYVLVDGQQSGPFTEETVRAMVDSGTIQRTCPAWREGMTDWRPLEEVITVQATTPPAIPEGLPPIPPPEDTPPDHERGHTRRPRTAPPGWQSRRDSQAGQPAQSSTIRTVSAVIALILGLLSIFSIGGCMHAQSELQQFQTGSDPADGLNMFVDTVRGSNQGDPLRGVAGLLDKAQSLKEDASSSQLGAWLCVIGTGISGFVFICSKNGKGSP